MNWLKNIALIALALHGTEICLAGQPKTASPANKHEDAQIEFLALETAIFSSPVRQLNALEHRVARFMQLAPSMPESQYLMSSVLLRLFLVEPSNLSLLRQSADLAAQTYALDQKSDLGVVALANVLDVSGELEKAHELLELMSKKKMNLTWRFYIAKANLQVSEGLLEKSLESFDLALQDSSADPNRIAPQIIAIIAAGGRYEHAVHKLIVWQKQYPCYDFTVALANFYMNSGKFDDAEKLVNVVVPTNPERIEGLVVQSILLSHHRHDYAKAAIKLRQVIALGAPDQMLPSVHLELAIALLKSNHHDVDKQTLINAVTFAVNPEMAAIKLFDVLVKQKRYENAVSFLSALDSKAPGLALAYALRGELLSTKLQRHQDAIQAYSDAIVIDPERGIFYNGRGLAHYGLKDFKSALSDFEFASKVDPSNASSRYNTACALALMGRKLEAVQALARAIDLDDNLFKQAQTDSDFSSIRSLPEFVALGEDVSFDASMAH